MRFLLAALVVLAALAFASPAPAACSGGSCGLLPGRPVVRVFNAVRERKPVRSFLARLFGR
jgi:hypothetical protein